MFSNYGNNNSGGVGFEPCMQRGQLADFNLTRQNNKDERNYRLTNPISRFIIYTVKQINYLCRS